MRWAIANGIILGYGDGTCRPLAEITHEQAVAILHRFVKYLDRDAGIPMVLSAQLDYSDWAEDDVLWALSAGLFNGFGSDISDLTQQANRAEVAAYLHRLCKMLEK